MRRGNTSEPQRHAFYQACNRQVLIENNSNAGLQVHHTMRRVVPRPPRKRALRRGPHAALTPVTLPRGRPSQDSLGLITEMTRAEGPSRELHVLTALAGWRGGSGQLFKFSHSLSSVAHARRLRCVHCTV